MGWKLATIEAKGVTQTANQTCSVKVPFEGQAVAMVADPLTCSLRAANTSQEGFVRPSII